MEQAFPSGQKASDFSYSLPVRSIVPSVPGSYCFPPPLVMHYAAACQNLMTECSSFITIIHLFRSITDQPTCLHPTFASNYLTWFGLFFSALYRWLSFVSLQATEPCASEISFLSVALSIICSLALLKRTTTDTPTRVSQIASSFDKRYSSVFPACIDSYCRKSVHLCAVLRS